jgi:hypothetical protein
MDQPVNTLKEQTVAQLIEQSLKLRDWMDAETERFNSFLKPHNEQREAIANEINRRMIEQQVDNFTVKGIGTAFKQIRNAYKSEDKTSFLDWVLDNWDQWGAMLQIGNPQADAVKSYMDSNSGQLPPTVTNTPTMQVHIRRSK